jgi:hypothetical protein
MVELALSIEKHPVRHNVTPVSKKKTDIFAKSFIAGIIEYSSALRKRRKGRKFDIIGA